MTAKTLLAWNLFLVALVLISPTTLLFSEVYLGLIIISIVFMAMMVGYQAGGMRRYDRRPDTPSRREVQVIVNSSNYRLLSLGILSCLCSISAARFYTGDWPMGIISDQLSGVSNYIQYQRRFVEEGVGVFRLTKIPFLLMLAAVKFNVIIQVLLVFWMLQRPRVTDFVGLGLSIIAFLYFSFARGTSFEVFELCILIYLGFLLHSQKEHGSWNISARNKIWVGLLAAIALVWYGYNLDSRGAYFVCSVAGICIDPHASLYQLSPELGTLIFRLNAYFTFGLQLMNEFIREIFEGNLREIITYIVPFGPFFTNMESSISQVCEAAIFCDFQWIPDSARFIDSMGIMVALVIAGLLGFAGRVLEQSVIRGSLIGAGLLFFVLLQLIAFPVGNFLFSSSANILSLFLFLMAATFPAVSRLLARAYGVSRHMPNKS